MSEYERFIAHYDAEIARLQGDLEGAEAGYQRAVQLTDAMAKMIGVSPFHGLRFEGERFDCGDKAGFLEANIAFALGRDDLRSQVNDILAKYS